MSGYQQPAGGFRQIGQQQMTNAQQIQPAWAVEAAHSLIASANGEAYRRHRQDRQARRWYCSDLHRYALVADALPSSMAVLEMVLLGMAETVN